MRNSQCPGTQTSRDRSAGVVVRRRSAAMLAVFGALGCGCGGGRSQQVDGDDFEQADMGSADGPTSTLPCVGEGETLLVAIGETCCPGLTTVACALQQASSDGSPGTATCVGAAFQCAVCVQGCDDGKCTLGENECNCPQDCDTAANQPNCYPDDIAFDSPSGYWEWRLEGTTSATPDPNVNCCELASRVFAYDDNCGQTLAYPSRLICLPNCGDRKCGGMETSCSCPWDCLTDTAGCYREGYTYNPGTTSTLAIKDPGACCPGLTAVKEGYANPDGTCFFDLYGELMCLTCGDGVCTAGENICNCPADCH